MSIFKRFKIDEETLHNFRVSGDATKLESHLPSPGYITANRMEYHALPIKQDMVEFLLINATFCLENSNV